MKNNSLYIPGNPDHSLTYLLTYLLAVIVVVVVVAVVALVTRGTLSPLLPVVLERI